MAKPIDYLMGLKGCVFCLPLGQGDNKYVCQQTQADGKDECTMDNWASCPVRDALTRSRHEPHKP